MSPGFPFSPETRFLRMVPVPFPRASVPALEPVAPETLDEVLQEKPLPAASIPHPDVGPLVRLDARTEGMYRLSGVLYRPTSGRLPLHVLDVSILGSPNLAWKMDVTEHNGWVIQSCRSVILLAPNRVIVHVDRADPTDLHVYAAIVPSAFIAR